MMEVTRLREAWKFGFYGELMNYLDRDSVPTENTNILWQETLLQLIIDTGLHNLIYNFHNNRWLWQESFLRHDKECRMFTVVYKHWTV